MKVRKILQFEKLQTRTTINLLAALIFLSCAATELSQSAPARRALLIGINLYEPSGTTAQHPSSCQGGRCDLPAFKNLDGPINDVAAMRDLLSSPKFAFDPKNITILTNPDLPPSQLPFVKLPADETTHDGLLAVMQKYLVTQPNPGDTVVFYYAGHGSLRVNSKGTKLPMNVNGKPTHADSTLVPADAWTGTYDVRDREMTRIFNAALDKGIKLTVLLDSCHSGSFTRGVELGTQYTERSLAYDPRDINEAPELLPSGERKPTPAERKENPALIFSAAQQDQTAKERPFGESSSAETSHGAFTVALIKALEMQPADAPAADIYRQVRATIEGEGVADQTPSIDASKDRLSQPLFGGQKSGNEKLRAAVIGIDDEGVVLLDAGQLAGINVGSEFTQGTIKLRVESLQGLTHARAKIITPHDAKITIGQVFELSKWIPLDVNLLHFWTWPASLPASTIQNAATLIKSSGVKIATDPAEQSWTDMLAWNGTEWELHHAGSNIKISLGPTLSADALKKNLSPDALLWANLPPPQELYSKLNLNEANSLVVEAKDATQAEYLLAGTLTDDGPSWAWYHKTEFAAGPRTTISKDHTPGCSTQSQYPVRSDWVALPDAQSLTDASAELNDYALRLARVNGWLNIAGNLSGGYQSDYYKLTFKRVSDQSVLKEDEPVKQDERLKMFLSADDRISEKRWVYVLDIDCHGHGTLLYPTQSAENRFPNNADTPLEIELPGAPTLRIGPPYGVDTVILLSSQEQLPDPSALNFKGVGERSASRGSTNPLEQLLSNTSSGTRGVSMEMPTNWSMDTTLLKSLPK